MVVNTAATLMIIKGNKALFCTLQQLLFYNSLLVLEEKTIHHGLKN